MKYKQIGIIQHICSKSSKKQKLLLTQQQSSTNTINKWIQDLDNMKKNNEKEFLKLDSTIV